MQARQLPGCALHAHGFHIAAHIEPAHDTGTDSYDFEVLKGPAVNVAVLDCRVTARDAPSVTGLALAALHHARSTGVDLAEQADLAFQAIWGHFRGRATVDALLVRLELDPWRVPAVSTAGVTLTQQQSQPKRVDLLAQDAMGEAEDTQYRVQHVHIPRGARIVLTGDGLAAPNPDPNSSNDALNAQLKQLRTERPANVVRQIMTDLLERHGADGPEQDAPWCVWTHSFHITECSEVALRP